MSKRKEREAQFLQRGSGAVASFSDALLQCAFSELGLALAERQHSFHRTPTNHYTSHAVGSILLLVAGLEVWLNEAIYTFGGTNQDFMRLAFEPVSKKYYEIPQRVAKAEIPPRTELDLVIQLRHEIVHYLPRVVKEEGSVPNWFLELHKRRLFITSSSSEGDFVLAHKLGSYRLAYWAFESVAGAVADLLDALGAKADSIRLTASNFGHYRSAPSPTELAAFDFEHKLELTENEQRKKKATN